MAPIGIYNVPAKCLGGKLDHGILCENMRIFFARLEQAKNNVHKSTYFTYKQINIFYIFLFSISILGLLELTRTD